MRIDRWLELKRAIFVGGLLGLTKNVEKALKNLRKSGSGHVSKLFSDQAPVNRQDFSTSDDRYFWQPGSWQLAAGQQIFLRIQGWRNLGGDGCNQDVKLPVVERFGREDNGRTLLGGGKVGKGEWQEDDVAGLTGCRRWRRRGSPRTGRSVQRDLGSLSLQPQFSANAANRPISVAGDPAKNAEWLVQRLERTHASGLPPASKYSAQGYFLSSSLSMVRGSCVLIAG